MARGFSSESVIEAIVESVIARSLAGGQQQCILDIGQRQEEEGDNSMEMSGDVIELAELSRDLTALLIDLQAMEERLGVPGIRSLYSRRRCSRSFEGEAGRRRRERDSTRSFEGEAGSRRRRGPRSFEGEAGRRRRERVEVGLERSRQRRLNRCVGINGYYCETSNIYRILLLTF